MNRIRRWAWGIPFAMAIFLALFALAALAAAAVVFFADGAQGLTGYYLGPAILSAGGQVLATPMTIEADGPISLSS